MATEQMIDDLMRQAGLEAIADKDSRAAAGQEMTSPEQDRYDAIVYFAELVDKAARVQALEEAAKLCKPWRSPEGIASDIRLLGEDAGRGNR